MKIKIILMLAFALCLAMSVSAQMPNKSSDKMSKKMTPEETLMNKERSAWEALAAKRWNDFGNLLAADYQGMEGGVLNSKASEVSQVQQLNFTDLMISDMKVTWIDKNAAIVTSVVSVAINPAGGTTAASKAQTASIWRKTGKDWHVVFHTDSPLK